MSIKIMAEVWDHAPVKGGALLFLLALADQAGDQDRCAWPGVSTLSHRARCSERSAYEYAAELQRLGILTRLEDDDRPSRYSRQRGRETTCWRINEAAQWTPAETAPLRDSGTDPCGGSQGTPAVARTRTTTTHQGEQNPHLPAARVKVSRSERPKRRGKAVADTGEDQERTGSLPDEQPSAEVTSIRKPTIGGLAKAFEREARTHYKLGDPRRITNMTALRDNMARWRDNGIELEDIAKAIEAFWASGMVREGQEPWKRFITTITVTLGKASAPDITNPDYYTTTKEHEMDAAEKWLKENGL